jgi:single-stranded-DNA-specific exonuclease
LVLPPPTPSEAAFEALLAQFDEIDGSATRAAALMDNRNVLATVDADKALRSATADDTAAPDTDDLRVFVEGLFAKGKEYLERDRFATIGDANDFFTKIMGVSFERRQEKVAGLEAGETLELVRELDNEHDPNAIAVRYGTIHLGYLRKEIAKRLAPNFDAGERYTAIVGSLTGGGPDKHTGVNIRVRRHRAAQRVPATQRLGWPDARGIDAIRALFLGERALRPAQLAVLDRLRTGRNTLAVMGTGRGKSLCFQLPATEAALKRRAKTLVFYPLRALANDQQDALVRRLDPLGLRVLRANGAIDGDERAALELALEEGSWDIILATPEFASYHRDAFARPQNRSDLLVVDEAHHLYESRHRPAYVGFGGLVKELGAPQVLALTATADGDAFREIRLVLGIESWVIDPTVRENLHVVDARNTKDKFAYLERALDGDGKAIVYCMSRSEAHKAADRLRRRFGPTVAFYHAGMPGAERTLVEDFFRNGALRIVVATSAFGEGIDLPDVRDVVLYHLNFAFTEFNQQAGRAGRDDAPAQIHLLYGEEDRRINDYLLRRTAPSVGVLRELYRGMRGLASFDVVRTNYEDVARTLELDNVDGTTISTAVGIWEEAGLAATGRDDEGRFVRFLEFSGKVDLTKTALFAEGEAERESFERFCKLALSADATTLEQIINRPIYPDRVPLEN